MNNYGADGESMRLASIIVENYRQFERAELNFDSGITILAGANNSAKTSLINLIKNQNYNMSDIHLFYIIKNSI